MQWLSEVRLQKKLEKVAYLLSIKMLVEKMIFKNGQQDK